MKLFLQKNAKFSSGGGFAPRPPLASGSWGLGPQTPSNSPPIANFWLRACTGHCFFFRSTFEFICRSLKNFIEKKNIHWRHSVPFRCRVAIALWRLGGGADYRSISEHFGLGKSTVHLVICILCYNNTHFYVDYTVPCSQLRSNTYAIVATFRSQLKYANTLWRF